MAVVNRSTGGTGATVKISSDEPVNITLYPGTQYRINSDKFITVDKMETSAIEPPIDVMTIRYKKAVVK